MIAAVIVLALLNLTFKAVGPALLGGREFPARTRTLIDLLPAALLGALLAADLLGPGWRDADATVLPGLAVMLLLRRFGVSDLVCLAGAVVVTAGVRLALG